MPNSRYPKHCYIMLKNLDEAGRTTWASHIKSLIFEHGFGYAWIAQEIGDIDFFLKLFKRRLKDISFQKWLSKVQESPKANYYKYYKTNIEVEKYL